MATDPVNRFCGEPLSEWIEKVPNELEVDKIHGVESDDIIEAVFDEWKAMEREPDVGDVRFILPDFIDS